jgi:hypothetical protein
VFTKTDVLPKKFGITEEFMKNLIFLLLLIVCPLLLAIGEPACYVNIKNPGAEEGTKYWTLTLDKDEKGTMGVDYSTDLMSNVFKIYTQKSSIVFSQQDIEFLKPQGLPLQCEFDGKKDGFTNNHVVLLVEVYDDYNNRVDYDTVVVDGGNNYKWENYKTTYISTGGVTEKGTVNIHFLLNYSYDKAYETGFLYIGTSVILFQIIS